MTETKNFQGINYYPNLEKENSYFYFPERPCPQVDTEDNPMISITGAASFWFLQASTLWKANSETIEALAKQLMVEELISSASELSLAPISVEKAELILITADGEQVLATSKSSGYYPFSAVFNSNVSANLQEDVMAAFKGKKDQLIIRYFAKNEIAYPVELLLTGSIENIYNSLEKDASEEQIKTFLKNEIKKGSLTIRHHFNETTPKALIDKAYQKLYDVATHELKQHLEQNSQSVDESSLEIKLTDSLTITEHMVTSTDISTWFKHKPDEHIRIMN